VAGPILAASRAISATTGRIRVRIFMSPPRADERILPPFERLRSGDCSAIGAAPI